MKEESQIHDMRAALRGDRERAEQARQRSTENVRALYEAPEQEPPAESQPEHQPRPSFLSRLLGR
ncbi:MAG: hypothetical protein QOF45_1156 [Gaiellaceae bacterium]|nr:hypothetical protein [Gaiellaceae bacterium]